MPRSKSNKITTAPDGGKVTESETYESNAVPSVPESASPELTDDILSPGFIEYVEAEGVRVPVAVLPGEWTEEDLSKYFPKRAPLFRQGEASFGDGESFAAYTKRHATEASVVYGVRTTTGGRFVAVLDDGAPKEPGRRVDRAVWEISHDERFSAWLEINGKEHSQAKLIDFVEEHEREFTTPSGAQMRTNINTLDVRKTVRFKNVLRDETAANDVNLIYETETTGDQVITFPTQMQIAVPVYRNTPPVALVARIKFDVKDGRLVFVIRLQSLYVITQTAWQQTAGNLAELLGEIPLLNGQPAA